MKKMFVTGMNTNKPKAYIEPEMKVIEVDVESLIADSDDYHIGAGDQPFVDEVKEEKLFWGFKYSVWD